MRILFDSNALITCCKFKVDDTPVLRLLSDRCRITIPSYVEKETTHYREYEDARIAADAIAQGIITVEHTEIPSGTFLDAYGLGYGEKEAICIWLRAEGTYDFLVTDDRLAYVVCDRMRISKVLLLDLLMTLWERGKLDQELVERIIDAVRLRYSEGFIRHTRTMLRRGDRRCL